MMDMIILFQLALLFIIPDLLVKFSYYLMIMNCD